MTSPEDNRDLLPVRDDTGKADSAPMMESEVEYPPVVLPADTTIAASAEKGSSSAVPPAPRLPTASDDVAPGWTKVDDAPLPPSEMEDKLPVPESSGLFGRPRIDQVLCLHDIRIDGGRTLVQVQWSGWGVLHADAVLEGQTFQRRMVYGLPRERELDFLLPVGATLTVSVRNVWGSDHRTLEVRASDPALPLVVVPPTPDVRGVQMPNPILPDFPSKVISRLIPSRLRVAMRVRRPLPTIDNRLRHAIAIESRRLSSLPWLIGSAQRYHRFKLSPSYPHPPLSPSYRSLAVPEVNMVPVRDRLKAWMVEIHHGEEETEGR